MTRQEKAFQQPRSPSAAVTLAVATVGLALNLRASILLSPHLHERFGVTREAYFLLIGLPLLVAALVRLPVGVLTDRWGARVMFPAVTLAAAVPVAGLGLAGSVPAVVVAGSAAGAASGAFVVGATLVTRVFPYGRRGLILGVFGLGVALAGGVSAISWALDQEGRTAALVLSGVLVAFAGLAALVLRDPVAGQDAASPLRRCVEVVRLASATSVTLLYVLALGGMASIAVFLPVFLETAFGFRWLHALAVTLTVIALSGLARMAGGWWTDRRPTAQLLTVCYGIAAGLCLVAATTPPWWLAAPVLTGIALCDGLASGALLALIGKAARPACAGVVMGMTGAAGAIGAMIPPLLFGALHRLMHSYVVAWAVLAATLVAAALYVRRHDLYIGLGLPLRSAPEPSPTAMTVAVLGESDVRLGAAAVVARLAELAASDELVIVYGADEPPRLSAHTLAAGLRHRLPRHSVVAVRVGRRADGLGRDALLLGEYIEAGTLTIAVAPPGDLRDVAADLSLFLQADRMVTVSYTPAEGAALHLV